jgi:predicted RNase H-like nuclease (RuvC/YqgF family)
MSATTAREKRARELLETAEIRSEIRNERRDRDAEIAALGAELMNRQQEIDRLRSQVDRFKAREQRSREALGLVEAHLSALRSTVNDDN